MGRQGGFTIVELVAVIIIVAVISVIVTPRFLDQSESLQASRDDTVAALLYAQQIAMARDSNANPIQLITTATTITVRENGSDLLHAGVQYPLALSNGVTLSPATTLDYDKLGRTTETAFTLSKGSVGATINVSGSGYAN